MSDSSGSSASHSLPERSHQPRLTAVTLTATPGGNGPFVVLNYSGTFTGSLANLASNDARANFTDSGSAISMTFTNATATRTWGGDSGTWESGGTGTFWVEGDQKFYNGDTVIFPDPAGPLTRTAGSRDSRNSRAPPRGS